MRNTDVCTLIKQVKAVDQYGDLTVTETTRQVFCSVASVGTKEFYQAHEVGFQPELKIILADYLDYQDEHYLLYGTTRYTVIRTYRNGTRLEITVTRDVNVGT